ncbi:MAG: DUF4349 domain-containing protein [Leptospiraceae bacterium]|nr:DUF4349 domain-containing protein [Leptospiraceae bacterium]MCP5501646.1 DUF4349 domain-containing protein [Leptospiraceae bacterium]
MSFLFRFLFIILLFFPSILFSTERKIESYYFSLMHPLPDKLISELRKLAGEHSGYTLSLHEKRLKLNLPSVEKNPVINKIRELAYINDSKERIEDISQNLLSLQSKLSVKEKYLQDLYSIVQNSKFAEALSTEIELGSTIQEVERLKGEIRKLTYQSENIIIEILINPSDSNTRINEVNRSSFRWIKILGVQNLYNREE